VASDQDGNPSVTGTIMMVIATGFVDREQVEEEVEENNRQPAYPDALPLSVLL
jgi:hypothetical protein